MLLHDARRLLSLVFFFRNYWRLVCLVSSDWLSGGFSICALSEFDIRVFIDIGGELYESVGVEAPILLSYTQKKMNGTPMTNHQHGVRGPPWVFH